MKLKKCVVIDDMPSYSGLDILQKIEGTTIKALLITRSTFTEDYIISLALIQLMYKSTTPSAFSKAVDNYLFSYSKQLDKII